MSTPRKYMFDASFDQPQAPVAVLVNKPPPEPTFTGAEVEAARATGLEEGRAAALAEASAAVERQLVAATESLAAGVPALLARDGEVRTDVERRALELLRGVVAKTFPVLAQRTSIDEIEALVTDCLREAFEEPRVVLRVPQRLFDPIRDRLGALAQQTGFAGKFVLLADDALGPADRPPEWGGGGAERVTDRLAREIDAVLERALSTPPSAPETPNQETTHE
jgi:flagellar assembly protein FliH